MQEEERESNKEKVWLGLSGLLLPCVFFAKGGEGEEEKQKSITSRSCTCRKTPADVFLAHKLDLKNKFQRARIFFSSQKARLFFLPFSFFLALVCQTFFISFRDLLLLSPLRYPRPKSSPAGPKMWVLRLDGCLRHKIGGYKERKGKKEKRLYYDEGKEGLQGQFSEPDRLTFVLSPPRAKQDPTIANKADFVAFFRHELLEYVDRE